MDSPLSPIPTIANSEKPDKIAGKLLEGRVTVITDGTFVLTVPNLFIEAFQSNRTIIPFPFFFLYKILRYAAFAFLSWTSLICCLLGFHKVLSLSGLWPCRSTRGCR